MHRRCGHCAEPANSGVPHRARNPVRGFPRSKKNGATVHLCRKKVYPVGYLSRNICGLNRRPANYAEASSYARRRKDTVAAGARKNQNKSAITKTPAVSKSNPRILKTPYYKKEFDTTVSFCHPWQNETCEF
ncbi:hypothetical protein TPHV1_200033 [Treponema phagedenis]|uniref:Uncharacterized protein n=1 Tax=Treponema phagedenis TaxID=162 RepID=A0A0B7GTC9_TREPH|nr:hypothetical protein TPHV1_200033 [Treponema phagedenis]